MLKLLLVEDNAGDARLLVEQLKEVSADTFEVTRVERLGEACEFLGANTVEVVLLDLNLPDSTGIDTFLTLHAAAPSVPVVLLTGLEDEALGLRAVQEGAQDFLVKGKACGAALGRSLRYAMERNRSLQWHMSKARYSAAGRVAVVMGAKGGAGTTTVALNCAATLAAERLVVAVELRCDLGSFSAHLKKMGSASLVSLLSRAPETITSLHLEQQLQKTQAGFFVLLGPQRVEEFQELTPQHAQRIVQQLAQMADIVIVDLPPGPWPFREAVVRAADAVLLVTERDEASLMSAKATTDQLRRWGIAPQAMGVVVVNRSPFLEPFSRERLEQATGCSLLGVMPPAPDVCMAAHKAGRPLVTVRPHSAPATALTSVAHRLAQLMAGQPLLSNIAV